MIILIFKFRTKNNNSGKPIFTNSKKPKEDSVINTNTQYVQSQKKEELQKPAFSSKQGGGKLIELDNKNELKPITTANKTKDVELEKPKFSGRNNNEPNFVELNKDNDVKYLYNNYN